MRLVVHVLAALGVSLVAAAPIFAARGGSSGHPSNTGVQTAQAPIPTITLPTLPIPIGSTTTTVATTTTTLATTTTTVPGTTTTTVQSQCCGFPLPGPGFLRFETVTQAGKCGTMTVGTGPIDLACSGLYFGGAGETVGLPANIPDMGVYISKVTSCSGTALTLDAASAADTGSIRTCSSAQGTCTPAALGTCNAATFTCTGTGGCTGGVCTQGKKGIACAADADCNLDCATDLDCGVCTAGNVGFHCLTDHACSCLFGAPLAVPNTTVPNASTCVINTVGNVNDTSSAGTADCSLGTSSTNTPLNSEIFLTGDLLPKRCSSSTTGGAAGFSCTTSANCSGGSCVNDPAIESCPICNETTLKCNGGPNEGASCTPGSSGAAVLGPAYPTSHDCPPPHVGADIGALAVPIVFTTGVSTKTSYSTGAGNGKSNVFCTFCKSSTAFANPPAPCSCDNGQSCGGFGPCASSAPSCEQNQNGAFAHADATKIEEDGVAAGDLTTGAMKSAIEVGAFCIPPSYNSLVDANAGLPGPGAVSLPGMSQLLP